MEACIPPGTISGISGLWPVSKRIDAKHRDHENSICRRKRARQSCSHRGHRGRCPPRPADRDLYQKRGVVVGAARPKPAIHANPERFTLAQRGPSRYRIRRIARRAWLSPVGDGRIVAVKRGRCRRNRGCTGQACTGKYDTSEAAAFQRL
jgi:hypothetical protein